MVSEFLEETRLALLTFKRNELHIELIIQLSIHVTMVLLSNTTYPLESGLQAIFSDSKSDTSGSLILLVLSILWSFKTTVLTSIAIKAESKKYFPLVPMMFLALRYLLVFLMRIGCIVAYFSPFLGLLGITDHYQAERIPLHKKTFTNLNGTFHYWNPIENFTSVDAHLLFRSNDAESGDSILPPTSNYTGIKLGMAFGFFGAMFLIYAILLALIKCCISKSFWKARRSDKLQHVIEVLNVPEAFSDWDSCDSDDPAIHFYKWKKVLLEMLLMVLFQVLTNLIMLVPFFELCKFDLSTPIYHSFT